MHPKRELHLRMSADFQILPRKRQCMFLAGGIPYVRVLPRLLAHRFLRLFSFEASDTSFGEVGFALENLPNVASRRTANEKDAPHRILS